jgi:hypothetical protein
MIYLCLCERGVRIVADSPPGLRPVDLATPRRQAFLALRNFPSLQPIFSRSISSVPCAINETPFPSTGTRPCTRQTGAIRLIRFL